jgi:lipid II:glycine glycyltransferase (peptidoglycan interpeptide bridge formation enzyme)
MWTQITTARAWDDALRQCHQPHVLQSWAWGEFKARWGWRAQRWALQEGERALACVQLLRRKVGPLCVLYAPKGPSLAIVQGASSPMRDVTRFLESQANQQRALWLKIDGDHWFAALPETRDLLRQRGWRYSSSQVQFRNTAISPIHKTDDELLAAMKQKCRYNVRLAQKRGVVVRPATPADDDLLYAMYAETAQRDGFLIREQAYYADAWRTMNAQGFVAEHGGKPLAGLILLAFANTAYYFYGMSRNEGREHQPTYALQFAAMRWARDNGCTAYDWWGAPEQADDESDSMAGVWRFKQGFGAQFAEGLGAWDYAPSPLLYKAYVELMPRLINLMKRRKQASTIN